MKNDTENFDNIDFIRRLNRLMLKEAEEAIIHNLPGDEIISKKEHEMYRNEAGQEKIEYYKWLTAEQKAALIEKKKILKRRHRMFGLSNPIVWVLEKIADTELKIAKQHIAQPEVASPTIDEKDMALVQRFLEKQTEQ